MPEVRISARAAHDRSATSGATRGWLHTAWTAVTGLMGGVLGLAPHVLHHIGLLGGTALVAGSGGTALFAVLGLVASIPLLLRLYRRFGNWRVPALALSVSTVLFLLSALVIGPAISGQGEKSGPVVPSVGHLSHH